MKKALHLLLLIALSTVASLSNAQQPEMIIPKEKAEVFVPDVVSSGSQEYGLAVTADWSTLYFTRHIADDAVIMKSNRQGTGWTKPATCSFSGGFNDGHPVLGPAEKKLYFISRRACAGASQALNVWVVTKNSDGSWNEAKPLGTNILKELIHAPTVATDGSLFFTGLKFIKKSEAGYSSSIKLNPDIKGSHPTIAPNGSYLIFSGRRELGFGGKDLYAIFAKPDGSWTEPKNLGPKINSKHVESSPTISRDGDALFFSRQGDIWWISTDEIKNLVSN
jgi:WD40-like Beta Propeller Repeat